VHHGKLVKELLEVEKNHIEVFCLPAYSQGRNPDEYVNCDLSQGVSAKPSPKSQEKLRGNVQDHIEMLKHNSCRVIKYFVHKGIQNAA